MLARRAICRAARVTSRKGLWCKLYAISDGAAIMTQMVELTPASKLFKGRQFDQEVIVLCVRWYLSFKLSSRDLVEILSERSIVLAHTTILRWVQRYVPEFEKLWKRYARPVGGSWRCDETYIKVTGRWTYPVSYTHLRAH